MGTFASAMDGRAPRAQQQQQQRRWLGAVIAVLMAAIASIAVPAVPAQAAFPGGDGKVAFTRANQVHTINPNGSGLVRLTSVGKNYWPRWSPDGRRIAYIHETASGSRDIWVMNANGSGKTKVTDLGFVLGPSWSADGRWIAFGGRSEPGGSTVLMRVRSVAPFAGLEVMLGTASGDPADLGPMDVSGAVTWSTGRQIWFYTQTYPSSPDHYIAALNIDTKAYTAFTASGGSCCGPGRVHQPAIAAGNQVIAWTYETDAPRLQLRSYPAGDVVPFTTVAQDEQLAFSPSGRRVVFMNDASGRPNIFIARPDGSGRRLLTAGYQPDWQPLR